jgi:hypothetical protein
VSTPLSAPAKARLALEVVASYPRVWWLLRRRGLRHTLAAVRRAPAGGAGPQLAPEAARGAGLRLGRAVTRTLAFLPTDSRCLMRSLVLVSLLARRGIECRLVIGVRPGQELRAHAWVEHEGRALLPTGATRAAPSPYVRLVEV